MQNFAYLIGDKATREVAVVDPAWDIDGLFNFIDEREYQLTGALVTHYHPDHCGGVLVTMLSKESPHRLDANRYRSMPMSMKSRECRR